jgi:multiple sugar transport system permease protein
LTLQGRQTLDAYIGLTPFLLGFILFTAGPVLYSLYLSFTKYDILSPPRWVGLDNYRSLFSTDSLARAAISVTTRYTLVVVPAGLVVGYVLALILNKANVKGMSFWRTAFYMPSVVPAMATAYLWGWMLQYDVGLVNQILRALHLPAPKWWGDPNVVLWAFIIMALWGAGGGVVLYLAALQGVPTTLYDAAIVDGANAFQRFWNITVPMTSPVIYFAFLTGMIGAFQTFTVGFITTSGGPANASLFYILYLYRNAWEYLKMGYGAAMAWVLFAILVLLTWLSLRVSRGLIYYESEGG